MTGIETSPRNATSEAWRLLVDTLAKERDQIAGRVSQAVRCGLPSYRAVPRAALEAEVASVLAQVLRCARTGVAASDDRELTRVAAVAERRARQGVPVADVLRAWRIGVSALVSGAREAGHDSGVDNAAVLEFVQSLLAWSDIAMVAAAAGHRRAELELGWVPDARRERFVRGALQGTISAAELRVQAEMHGIDPAGEFVAVRARVGENVSRRRLERALGFAGATPRHGLSGLIDGDLAGLLAVPPPRNVDGLVGYGPARPLERLSESYRWAARALVTAEACKLRGAHDTASLGLRSAIVTDVEMGGMLRQRYLEPLSVAGCADDLVATLRAFLACDMRVESTATRLFVHQNTVRYRLARFEELTGASLRETRVIVEVWWALEFSALGL